MVIQTFTPLTTVDFQEGVRFEAFGEDMYFTAGLLKLDKRVALDEFGTKFCSHTSFTAGSFCIHKTDYYYGEGGIGEVLKYCPEFGDFVGSKSGELMSK